MLPFPDASVDAIISVFGLIFATDASAAAAEMARVLTSSGRIVLSAWLPGGALGEQARLRREAVATALGETPGAAPFAWHDREALSVLLAPHGYSVEVHEETLAFTASSAKEYAEGEWKNHPLWVEVRAVLEPLGKWQAVCEATMEVFSDANEEPSSFRISSHYVVANASRSESM
jgi:SAM-dependent methyltransferase